ncbi:MAG: DNA helicase RecQ [bacterium]
MESPDTDSLINQISNDSLINQALSVLRDTFGYDAFKPLQREIIHNVLKKNDTMVIMPTGGGKSLCYQIPALIFQGLTVVVSPLISLMKDQVEQLRELGVKAVFLNSSLSYQEYKSAIRSIIRNEAKLLYLAPETLFKDKTLALLSSVKVDCFTIDEAHCISEWGHDFRPEYRRLIEIRNQIPSAVCIALTATATQRVRNDIKINLGFTQAHEFIASFNRENLFIEITPKSDPLSQSIHFLKKFPHQSGIIYCFSRRQVDDLYEVLQKEGFSVKPYHAGLSEKERTQNQELFIRDDVQVMVATIAFGMGINKPNIRFVIHYDLPKNIETYYQEIGRAGRDGLKAHCLLLFSYGDIQKVKYFITQENEQQQRIANFHLNALLQFIETDRCRRHPLLTYFGEHYSASNCKACDNCLVGEKELVDITIPAQKFLSCVKRTGEMFGASHIIDVLWGSQSQKVLKFNHQNLSTYGIGREHSKRQWFYLSRQFLQKGLMIQDMEFGSLKLTPKAYEVFKGTEKVLGKIRQDEVDFGLGKEDTLTCDHGLFELLRAKRKELADKGHVPPYVIFPDKTLMEMAAYFPQSAGSLLSLHGIGSAKGEKYGHMFLDIIRQYCQERGLKERPKPLAGQSFGLSKPLPRPSSGTAKLVPQPSSGASNPIPRPSSFNPKVVSKRKHVMIGEAYNSGQSIREIMETFNIKLDTVLNHLYKYLQEGHRIRSEELLTLSTLSSEQRTLVLNTIERLDTGYLKPVFEALEGKIGYPEIRILHLYYLSTRSTV